jgi:hypothetical protein
MRIGETVCLGALPIPAELAERLNATAQALGVSVAEVVRSEGTVGPLTWAAVCGALPARKVQARAQARAA